MVTSSAGKALIRPRRVLIVVQNLPVPFDRRVWLEATTLARAGYHVSVICPKAKAHTSSRERLEGVDIYRYTLPGNAAGAAGYLFEFAWCFVRTTMLTARIATVGRGFDVLHVCNPPETYFALGWIVRLFGKRFLFDHHDLSPEMYEAKFDHPNPRFTSLLRWFERQTFRAANVVVTTNASHRDIAIERGKVAEDDIFIVRSGPDLDRLTIYPPDPSYKRGKEHLIVYLGEICKQDGVDHLIRACVLLRDEFQRDDFHCLLVGGGPDQPRMKRYSTSMGADDICTFTGRVTDDDLCRMLSSADLAVDPDPKTPWSDKSTMNKIVEYMAFSLPIAAYDLTEHRVSAGDAALYAQANDERALATEVVRLLDSAELREELGAIGQRRLSKSLAWNHSAPVLLRAYDRAFADAR